MEIRLRRVIDKTVKKSLFFAVGRQKLLILNSRVTLLFEAANLINSRPICKHPTHHDDGYYLSPNEMLLGKPAAGGIAKVEERNNVGHRLSLVENVLKGFWKRWQMLYMYSMAPLKKWTKKHKNVQKSDVILVEDSNALRSHWTIGRVEECYPGSDVLVPGVEVEIVKANGAKITVSRPVEKLSSLAPIEEQKRAPECYVTLMLLRSQT